MAFSSSMSAISPDIVNASSPRMKYGVGISSFGSGSAAGNAMLLSSVILLELGRIENLSIGHVPIAAYIDLQELVVSINKAH